MKDFIISFEKAFFMNLCLGLSFTKIKNDSKKKSKMSKLFYVVLCAIYGVLYCLIYEKIGTNYESFVVFFVNILYYVTFLIIFSIIMNEIDKSFFLVMLLSVCFSLTAFSISVVIVWILTKIKLFVNLRHSVIEYMLMGCIEFLLINELYKVKRFKDGFSFIKEERLSKNINIIGFTLVIIISIFTIYVINRNYLADVISIIGIIIGVILILFFIRKAITMNYKAKMKDRTVETLTEQLKEKDQTIENLKSELSKTLKINHKYNHRISAMEKAVSKLEFNEEFASEHGDIIALVKELSENYKSELLPADNQEIIQKTNVFAIDNMLEYMATKASKSNIALKVEVKCDVKDMTENIIDKNKLETLLADHINDAIIAIQHCTEKSGKILVKFEIHDSIYEVKIYDTGIEFEINTLLQLGKHQVTTHKDSGGSGIGFMTTFETLRACKGSLIIEEYNNQTTDYTKAIVARFDNNNEYKICSYRSDEIKIEAEKQEKYNNMENIMPLLVVAKGKQEK